VKQIDDEGNIIKQFDSIVQASKFYVNLGLLSPKESPKMHRRKINNNSIIGINLITEKHKNKYRLIDLQKI